MNPTFVYLFFSFLVGSIPFGVFVARAFNVKDLTTRGSGNIGATNVSRVLGFWPAGFLTFAFDFAKGAIPVLLISLDSSRGWIVPLLNHGFDPGLGTIWSSGLFAVLGHCFSPWLKFRGGKGVATGFGAIAVLSPISAASAALVYLFSFLLTGVSSQSSLLAVGMAVVTYLVLNPFGPHVWAGALIVATIYLRHESNINALLERREHAF